LGGTGEASKEKVEPVREEKVGRSLGEGRGE